MEVMRNKVAKEDLRDRHDVVKADTVTRYELHDAQNASLPEDHDWLVQYCQRRLATDHVTGVDRSVVGALCRQKAMSPTPSKSLEAAQGDENKEECRKASKHFIKEWDIALSADEERYVSSLLGKRQSRYSALYYPVSGFRVRKEYRRLSDGERDEFHEAFIQLRKAGHLLTFTKLHRGETIRRIHRGPNFMGWHRVFITLVEEGLRQFNPRVSMPYWDSSLDHAMDNPNCSIVWSPDFLGNGEGPVVTGPFAHWDALGAYQRPHRLNRNVGAVGATYSKKFIKNFLSRCHTKEVSELWAQRKYSLEKHHDAVHNWVGGDMSFLELAPFDPVFFLHHAFVDYLWEEFRRSQAKNCGVDPTQDYPGKSCHPRYARMDHFEEIKNIDGYADFWTSHWFNYEPSPTCRSEQPTCNSPYLTCDTGRFICKSIARKLDPETEVKYEGPDVIPEVDRRTGTKFE